MSNSFEFYQDTLITDQYSAELYFTWLIHWLPHRDTKLAWWLAQVHLTRSMIQRRDCQSLGSGTVAGIFDFIVGLRSEEWTECNASICCLARKCQGGSWTLILKTGPLLIPTDFEHKETLFDRNDLQCLKSSDMAYVVVVLKMQSIKTVSYRIYIRSCCQPFCW
jgi:hypothetical protein